MLQRHVANCTRFTRRASTKIIDDGITVTRKKYIDMPPSYTLIDGVVRAPLPPFDGGILPKPRIWKLVEKAAADGMSLLYEPHPLTDAL